MSSIAVHLKLVVLLLLIHCLFLIPFCCGFFVVGTLFVEQYLVSFQVLQLSCWGKERVWLWQSTTVFYHK